MTTQRAFTLLVALCYVFLLHAENARAFCADASLSEYSGFLKTLDRNELASVDKAADRYVALMASRKQAARDEGFSRFLRFYNQACDALAISLNKECEKKWRSIDYDEFVRKHDAEIRRYGMRLDSTEGIWIIAQFPEPVVSRFRLYVSEAVKDYLDIRSRELGGLFVDDGAICTPADEIGVRLATWERHLSRFPHSALRADAVILYRMYLKAFLMGDNYITPFERSSDSSSVLPNAWRRYLKEHAGTKSAKIVQRYLDICTEQHFECTQAVEQYLKDLDKDLDSLGRGPTDAIYIDSYFGVSGQANVGK